ncbi:MAG TPA: NAD-dependent epimerase [Micromonosporaceae bacterium]|nr:NAD-dependent epimerase [Micromonosporaceae bacterium]
MHVIVGAGAIGSLTARLLAQRGEKVRVISRSGRGPSAPGVELVAADATDAARLTELTKGAAALYNCANPLYYNWLTDWPPIAASLLKAAGANDAVLVTTNNLYGHGKVDGPITEHTPLTATHPKLRVRRQMWEDALAAHESGKVRVTEARASDYIGVDANSVLCDVVLSRTAKGKSALAFGDPDAPHSWTNVDDVATTLVTIAQDERAWGKAWLVPTAPAISVRAAASRANELIGQKPARVTALPYGALWSVGLFSKVVKELRATYYQFSGPFTVDSSFTEKTFGLQPTPLDESLRAAALAYRDR